MVWIPVGYGIFYKLNTRSPDQKKEILYGFLRQIGVQQMMMIFY